MLREAVRILDAKKAEDIKAIDIRGISVIADYFLIVSGLNAPHVKALAGELDEKLSALGVSPIRTEGVQTAEWVIMDYGDLVIHIFQKETRGFFGLERLWAEGGQIDTAPWLQNAREGSSCDTTMQK